MFGLPVHHGTHWVSAVVVVAVVVVVVVVAEGKDRAKLIGSEADPPGRRGLIGY